MSHNFHTNLLRELVSKMSFEKESPKKQSTPAHDDRSLESSQPPDAVENTETTCEDETSNDYGEEQSLRTATSGSSSEEEEEEDDDVPLNTLVLQQSAPEETTIRNDTERTDNNDTETQCLDETDFIDSCAVPNNQEAERAATIEYNTPQLFIGNIEAACPPSQQQTNEESTAVEPSTTTSSSNITEQRITTPTEPQDKHTHVSVKQPLSTQESITSSNHDKTTTDIRTVNTDDVIDAEQNSTLLCCSKDSDNQPNTNERDPPLVAEEPTNQEQGDREGPLQEETSNEETEVRYLESHDDSSANSNQHQDLPSSPLHLDTSAQVIPSPRNLDDTTHSEASNQPIQAPTVPVEITPFKSTPVDTTTVVQAPLTESTVKEYSRRSLKEIVTKDLWSRDAAVVENALHVLTIDAFYDERARDSIARTGGILAIVRAMETHNENTCVQVAACQALEKLALNEQNELAINDVGGVEAILGAMMGHFDCSNVQEAAWAALWNLSCGNAGNDMTIDSAGGIAAIVSAMKRHVHVASVQKNACGALANLCLDNESRLQALADADGFVAIATALQRHWSHPEVRKEAGHALARLAGPPTHDDVSLLHDEEDFYL